MIPNIEESNIENFKNNKIYLYIILGGFIYV